MSRFKFIIFALLFCACSAVKVNYDYDSETDFSAYNTFNYLSDMQTGFSELDEKRLFRALDVVLQTKGLKFSEEPDLLLDIKAVVYEGQSRNTVGVGLGGGGGNIGGGVSVGIPVGAPNQTQEMELNFIDAKRDILVWQAVSRAPFKEGDPPAVKEKKIQELVAKVFEKYPPKQ